MNFFLLPDFSIGVESRKANSLTSKFD